jgi:SAM-dependent methyltransferase
MDRPEANNGISRLKRWPIYRMARFLYRFSTDAEYRSVALIRFEKPPGLFQPFIDTLPDRYPILFAFAREKLGADTQARVLSFGCSTGEEVFALRRYLPMATIKGIDINRRNIAICNARCRSSPDPAIVFEVGGSTRTEEIGSYDAIFCLAVLRHGDLSAFGGDRCDHIIRFADFERVVGDFSRCLRPGGLLFIAHSNFRFSDTAAARGFEVVFRVPTPEPDPRTPVFDRNNRLMHGAAYGEMVFRKLPHYAQQAAHDA